MKSDGFPGQVVRAVSRRTPAFDHDCRPEIAAELRRLADELDVRREEMRTEDDRTVRSSGLGEGTRRIRERADELDPQGGAV